MTLDEAINFSINNEVEYQGIIYENATTLCESFTK